MSAAGASTAAVSTAGAMGVVGVLLLRERITSLEVVVSASVSRDFTPVPKLGGSAMGTCSRGGGCGTAAATVSLRVHVSESRDSRNLLLSA
jgi:hypothetical protein